MENLITAMLSMTIKIQLNSVDTLAIETVRMRRVSASRVYISKQYSNLFEYIDSLFARLINLLLEVDPFVVKLLPPFEPAKTLFEIQLLYVISEARQHNIEIVRSILYWWFPDPIVPEAERLIHQIAGALNKSGTTIGSTQLLKNLILEAAGKPLQKTTRIEIDLELTQCPSDSIIETIH